jgi:predicted anti-sigma-YlaC factor YlaD
MGAAPVAHVHAVAARQYGYLPKASEGIGSPIVTYLWFLKGCSGHRNAVKIEAHLHTFDSKIEVPAHLLPTPRRRPKKARRHEPHSDLRTQFYCVSGVDLTRIDGIEVLTAQTLIAELGLDMHRWKTETHFASWLG